MNRFLALAIALALTAACAGEATLLSGQPIVSLVPWTKPETSLYRLVQGDDVIGSGELSIDPAEERVVFRQSFQFAGQELVDEVSVDADPRTMRPLRVQRVISGPEGERRCEASYEDGRAVVQQRTEEDQRRDELAVPTRAYDSWSDLFLWRTLAFAEGFEARYTDVLSCTLAEPQVLSVVLKVSRLETVTVPAGTFEAWRLEIRSGGRTQRAWYGDDAARTLLRYDNGDLVFELESRE